MAAVTEAVQNDLAAIREEIREGFRKVLTPDQNISSEEFMRYYTLVHNYCCKNRGRRVEVQEETPRPSFTSRVRDRLPRWLGGTGGAGNNNDNGPRQTVFGDDVYEHIETILTEHLNELLARAKDLKGEVLLTFYNANWERFKFSSKVLNGICGYLNRHWVLIETEKGRTNLFEIYQLAINKWKKILFQSVQDKTISVAINLINTDRRGGEVNRTMIKNLIYSLIELGRDFEAEQGGKLPTGDDSDDHELIRRRFEVRFLAETEKFYMDEAEEFLKSKPVTEYMIKVEQRLIEEKDRVSLYLRDNEKTLSRLIKTCERALIEKQAKVLCNEFPVLLKADKVNDMSRLYDLLIRLGNSSFGNMQQVFEQHVASEGSAALLQNTELCNKDAKEYITTAWKIYQKFREILSTAFKQNKSFLSALERGFSTFINENELNKGPQNVHKSADMLAKYTDILLKKADKSIVDDKLNIMIITIFKHINDKDVFLKYYTNKLALRLLSNFSYSDEEIQFINKVKVISGFEYTRKLERMFNDMDLSKEMNVDFQTWIKKKKYDKHLTTQFSAFTLVSGSWPFAPDKVQFSVPEELESWIIIFEKYYATKHSGRKLHWLHSKSRGELVTNCFEEGKNHYALSLPIYSIVVLLQYNMKDSYKVKELVEATNLKDYIIQIVQALMKSNMMKSNDPINGLSFESEVFLNKEYKNKKFITNMSCLEGGSDAENLQELKQERIIIVKAAIVRVMKVRKTLGHEELVAEVTGILIQRFYPTPEHFQKSITWLTENEYIKLKTSEPTEYEYIV